MFQFLSQKQKQQLLLFLSPAVNSSSSFMLSSPISIHQVTNFIHQHVYLIFYGTDKNISFLNIERIFVGTQVNSQSKSNLGYASIFVPKAEVAASPFPVSSSQLIIILHVIFTNFYSSRHKLYSSSFLVVFYGTGRKIQKKTQNQYFDLIYNISKSKVPTCWGKGRVSFVH